MVKGKVSIIGGGIAGLLAAVELARAGAGVSLFETASAPGGRARSREVQGFRLNQGPHALYKNGAFRRELDRLGIPYSGGDALGGSPKALWQGRLHSLPVTTAALLTTGLFSPADKLAYTQAFRTLMKDMPEEQPFSVWLDRLGLSPVLRQALEALARLTSYANGPEIVSAPRLLDQIRMSLGGTLYLDGGWQTVVDALEDAAIDAGVRFHYSSAARRITSVSGQVRVELESGAEHTADAVLLALGPNEAAALVPGAASLQSEARAALPVRANTLDLALSRLPPRAHSFALGIDTPVYFSNHSASAAVAPEGGAVVHIAKYLPAGEDPGPGAIEELEMVADRVMPGWRAFEVRRQTLRGMTVSNAFPRWDHPRPDVAVADAPGLFVAGDWTGPEGMIADAAAASAIRAARAILAGLSAAAGRDAA